MDEAKQFIYVNSLWIQVIPNRLPLQGCIGFMKNSQYLKKEMLHSGQWNTFENFCIYVQSEQGIQGGFV